MKLPESTATVRSRRQQRRPARSTACAGRSRRGAGDGRRYGDVAPADPRRDRGAHGVRRGTRCVGATDAERRPRRWPATSPSTPRSTGRCAPSASGVEVDLHHRAPRDRSACRAAWSTCSARSPSRRPGPRRGSARRPAARRTRRRCPSDHGSPANSPCATAEVASSAPDALGRAPRSSRPGRAGRRGRRRTPAAAARRAARRARRPRRRPAGGAGAGPPAASAARPGPAAACTSSGRLSTTVRRCSTAVRYARTASATAEPAECTRSATAPTAVGQAAWSMRKFERTAAAPVSAASTSSGVRLLAASVMPVIALVSPQPWCTVQHRRAGRWSARRRRPSSPRRPRAGRRRTGRRPRPARW